MQRLVFALTLAAGVGLATACAGSDPGEAATVTDAVPNGASTTAATAPVATGGGSAAGSVATSAAAHPEGHVTATPGHEGMAGMGQSDASAVPDSVQAGWYRDGTFQPCGRAENLKLSGTAQIESEIQVGGMQAGEPVYIRLSGERRDDVFQVKQVVQVGSPTPVRDCPMTGTVIQGG